MDDPWGSFTSSTPAASTAAWALDDVIPDWSSSTPAATALPETSNTVQASPAIEPKLSLPPLTREDSVSDDPWASAVSPPPLSQNAYIPKSSMERIPEEDLLSSNTSLNLDAAELKDSVTDQSELFVANEPGAPSNLPQAELSERDNSTGKLTGKLEESSTESNGDYRTEDNVTAIDIDASRDIKDPRATERTEQTQQTESVAEERTEETQQTEARAKERTEETQQTEARAKERTEETQRTESIAEPIATIKSEDNNRTPVVLPESADGDGTGHQEDEMPVATESESLEEVSTSPAPEDVSNMAGKGEENSEAAADIVYSADSSLSESKLDNEIKPEMEDVTELEKSESTDLRESGWSEKDTDVFATPTATEHFNGLQESLVESGTFSPIDDADDPFANPFSSSSTPATKSTADYMTDIFPLTTSITSEQDNIANFFSDSQIPPPPLLSFGRARKFSNMFTRPTRQFFTPDPKQLPKSGSASPASSIYTNDDGIRVKWKHTEIQSRVQNVVDHWKNEVKQTGRLFDWDNADAVSPSSPIKQFIQDSLKSNTGMEQIPGNGPYFSQSKSVNGPTEINSKPVAISFGWQDSQGLNAWRDSPSVQDEPHSQFSQIPTVITPSLETVRPVNSSASSAIRVTQVDDNLDDWGDFSTTERPKLNSLTPSEVPAVSQNAEYGKDKTENSDLSTVLVPTNAELVGKPALQIAIPSQDVDDDFGEFTSSPVKQTGSQQIPQTQLSSPGLTQPIIPVASSESTKITVVQDDDDWSDLMASNVSAVSNPVTRSIDDVMSSEPSSGNQSDHQATPANHAAKRHHDHHHHKSKHMSGIYIPPPKPSSPTSSLYIDSSSSSASSSTTDLSSIHVGGLTRHGAMTLSPTAPKSTDAKLRDDEIVRNIVDAIPDIDYLLD